MVHPVVPSEANRPPTTGRTSAQRNPYAETAGAASHLALIGTSNLDDGNTPDSELPTEPEARQRFIDRWLSQASSNASQEASSRRRSRSLDEDDPSAADSPPSPTSYSNRSKTARQACCDCSRSGACGLNVDCPCRLARKVCTDCDPEICGGRCTNRPGKLPARPRPHSTRLRDRQRELEQARFQASLPPAPVRASPTAADPNSGPSGGPTGAATRGGTAEAARTANSSTAAAANPSTAEGAAQDSNGAEGAVGDAPSAAPRGSGTRAGSSRSAATDPSGRAPQQRTRGAFVFGQSAEDGQERAEFDVQVDEAAHQPQQPADADGGDNADGGNVPEGGGEEANNAEGEGTTAAAEDNNNDGDGGGGTEGEDDEDDPPAEWDWADVREVDNQIHAYAACDDKLFEVYGDTIHRNTGDHMPGGVDVVQDAFWRRKYREVTSSNLSLMDLPSGKPSERFILKAIEEFKGVRERKWNSERVIVFFAVILRKEPGKWKYSENRELLKSRLDMWEAGKYATLCRACVERGRVYPVPSRREDPERRAKKYNAMVQAGKVRSAVRQATDRHGGAGLMGPFDYDYKSGKPVHEALADKHPNLVVPDLSDEDVICFEDYEKVPAMVPLTACDDILVQTAKRLRGGAGPGGVDSYLLKDILTKFERPSVLFRAEMGEWIHWMANESPPIGAMRAFLNNRLLAGKKTSPGVRPIACGEIFRCYWGK